ncbi:cupin domain-containing protein [Pelagibacterium sp.]|uniref:cupin domain-containing protein n=1 Tax=Pelagibacterium sp. TaxID=1967288 RepID=UPI003A8DF53E
MSGPAAVERLEFEDFGRFPNSRLSALIYRGAIDGDVSAEGFETLFSRNGWPARWVGSIYNYHHFHSTAHEVLGVASGSAQVALGGPKGRVVTLEAGDAVVIPAGVAHKRVSASADFAVVGAYPPGQEWDILNGEDGEREAALANIASVAVPDTDPVQGVAGTLHQAWSEE